MVTATAVFREKDKVGVKAIPMRSNNNNNSVFFSNKNVVSRTTTTLCLEQQ